MSENINTNPELSVPLNDIQARREARRRKILENAKDRLEILNGRIANENKDGNTIKPKTHRTFSDPEIETEELFGPKIPIINSNITRSFENKVFNENSVNTDTDLDNILRLLSQMSNRSPTSLSSQPNVQYPPRINEANIVTESKFNRFLKTKAHLFIISCLTYILFACENQIIIKYSVFLPLLIWELTETFIFKTNDNNTNLLLKVILMMGGISPNISNGLLKIIGTLNKILKDVGVFVFFFVFCHILCTT